MGTVRGRMDRKGVSVDTMLQVDRSKKFWCVLLASRVITSKNNIVYFHELEDKSALTERGRLSLLTDTLSYRDLNSYLKKTQSTFHTHTASDFSQFFVLRISFISSYQSHNKWQSSKL